MEEARDVGKRRHEDLDAPLGMQVRSWKNYFSKILKNLGIPSYVPSDVYNSFSDVPAFRYAQGSQTCGTEQRIFSCCEIAPSSD